MDENKMQLINKLFNNDTIRTLWDKEEEKYFISVVDIVSVISQSKDGRKYWNKLKQRLKAEGNESVTNCRQLKLKSSDGKYYNTDVCDIEGMFRIIESIPSKNAEPIKQWLAKLGKERINETFDPSVALQRAIDLYRAKGYDEDWIAKRIKSIQERKKLTDVWKENGIESNLEYAILTNEIYKGLRKESLRDNMDNIELILTDLSEEATKRLAAKQKPNGLKENMKVAKMGGHSAKVARDDIEKNLGESVVTKTNKLNYEYIEDEKVKKISDKGENQDG